MESYHKIEAIELDSSLGLSSVSYTDGNLILSFTKDEENFVRLKFGRSPSYRMTLEECFLSRLKTFPYKLSPGIWRVDKSEWLETFSDAELCLYPDSRHFIVMTEDEIIEIISELEPELSV